MTKCSVSDKEIAAIFTRWLFGFTLGYAATGFIMDVLLGFAPPAHMMGIVIVSAASLIAGDRYYKRTGILPEATLAWRVSALFMLVNIVVMVVMTALVSLIILLMGGEILSSQDLTLYSTYRWVILALIAMMLLIELLGCRICFSLGARSARQYLQKRAGDNVSRSP